MPSPLKVAVITGGHEYEVIAFHQLFRNLSGIDAYIQHMDEFASSTQAERDAYDVLVFYSFFQENPTDAGVPWYIGHHQSALVRLYETSQGIVLLHHAILVYQKLAMFDEIAGLTNRVIQSYRHDEDVDLHIADHAHPITRGLSDWRMIDETYAMHGAGTGNHILITSQHPRNMPTVAWTRTYSKSRVFCFQSGHDHQAYEDPTFRTVLERGIHWVAGVL